MYFNYIYPPPIFFQIHPPAPIQFWVLSRKKTKQNKTLGFQFALTQLLLGVSPAPSSTRGHNCLILTQFGTRNSV